MLGRLLADDFFHVDDPAEAEVIIVNTCGFIQEAVQESIDLILEMAEYKVQGKCRALVVVGCMTERYRADMQGELPEVDAVLGVADRDAITEVVRGLLSPGTGLLMHNRPEGIIPVDDLHYRLLARKNTDRPHIAYVKIAEGCDNHCAYCTIPAIRGGYKSRPMEEILEECEALINDGVRELVLVAQDTALYGKDLYGEVRLGLLLRGIDAACTQGQWVRLMYAYPEHITTEVIQALAELPSVCKYLDMPVQHSEDTVLSPMGRQGTRAGLVDLITRLRQAVPDIALRTTLMVGFPGETEAEFEGLYNFVETMQFDRLGVFPYSQEAGTKAAEMPNQVPEDEKHNRRERLMILQQEIHAKKQREKIGRTITVIIDEVTAEGDGFSHTARTQADAPEVDAVVYVESKKALTPGQVVEVRPVAADEYDLEAVTI